MNVMQRETALTVEQFLAWEDRQEGRHEFDGIRIVPMTGGSRAHQRIMLNLMRLLDERLAPGAFEAVPEVRLNVGSKIRYPDVSVCAGAIPDATRTLHDAVIVFEVLSADTARIDRQEKRAEYTALPSLQQYVMVEQTRSAITVVERTAETWRETEITQGDLNLPSVGITLPLTEIYANVRFT